MLLTDATACKFIDRQASGKATGMTMRAGGKQQWLSPAVVFEWHVQKHARAMLVILQHLAEHEDHHTALSAADADLRSRQQIPRP